MKLNFTKGLSKESQPCQVCKHEETVSVNLSFLILQSEGFH